MTRAARSRPLDGEFPYRHPIEVRYGDTDALGHVNNATYFSYFEAARGGYYRAVVGHAFGRGPGANRRTFVIAEAHITYRQPVLYGETVACAVRTAWVAGSSFCLEYRVEVEDPSADSARVAADGSTVQVFYDLEKGAVMRMPADLLESLTAFEGRQLPKRPTAT